MRKDSSCSHVRPKMDGRRMAMICDEELRIRVSALKSKSTSRKSVLAVFLLSGTFHAGKVVISYGESLFIQPKSDFPSILPDVTLNLLSSFRDLSLFLLHANIYRFFTFHSSTIPLYKVATPTITSSKTSNAGNPIGRVPRRSFH